VGGINQRYKGVGFGRRPTLILEAQVGPDAMIIMATAKTEYLPVIFTSLWLIDFSTALF
jgi:hypothetical protein